jgi:ankyrin repeat protein
MFMCVAGLGHLPDLTALIASGVDVNAPCDPMGHAPPLHVAAGNDFRDIPRCIARLIEAGARVDQRDTEGYTPCHCGADLAHVFPDRST